MNLQDITNFLNDVAKAFAALHSDLTADVIPEVSEDLAAQMMANPSMASELVMIDLYDIDIGEIDTGEDETFSYAVHVPNEVQRLVNVVIGSAGFVAGMYVAEPVEEMTEADVLGGPTGLEAGDPLSGSGDVGESTEGESTAGNAAGVDLAADNTGSDESDAEDETTS